MASLNRDCLSEHDRQVLESIFNPSQIGGEELIYTGKEEFPEDLQGIWISAFTTRYEYSK